ncbi:MAG: DUF1800 domain-containing protein [Saprospiraceae bacterium]|nr:DUF1800 domain-containing protein [Saprospiraceae bacterium]
MADCNNSNLDTYVPSSEKPWNEQRIKHLYFRLGYGITTKEITQLLSVNPIDHIENMLDHAYSLPVYPEPVWANWKPDQFNEEDGTEHYIIYNQFVTDWINECVQDPVRNKIAFFWSNHLVTKWEDYYYSPILYRYVILLQRNALGNFKTMISEIGLDDSMLIFLNGIQNTKYEPNENYARELFELFTLGLDNGYTETDIREAARAFTGFNDVDYENITIKFYPGTHDYGSKTIFGETGPFGYDDVVNLLFEKRGQLVCKFVCTKIYKHFVNAEPNQAIIDQLAQIMYDNNFELLPVFKKLFCSEHFFDQMEFNTHIKSHVEYFTGILKQFGYTINYDEGGSIIWFNSSLGQTYFDPIDVAGWKENKTWIDSGSLMTRWLYTGWMVDSIIWNNKDFVINFLKEISNDSNDVEYVMQCIIAPFFVNGLSAPIYYDNLLRAFKADLPQNYYDQGLWNLNWDPDFICYQVSLLFAEMKLLPEFGLC